MLCGGEGNAEARFQNFTECFVSSLFFRELSFLAETVTSHRMLMQRLRERSLSVHILLLWCRKTVFVSNFVHICVWYTVLGLSCAENNHRLTATNSKVRFWNAGCCSLLVSVTVQDTGYSVYKLRRGTSVVHTR